MKKRFIITLLVSALVFTGCGTKNEEEKTQYFDFTKNEIVNELEEWLIDYTLITIIDYEETEKIATYTCGSDVITITNGVDDGLLHYKFVYNDETNKVSSISFFLEEDIEQSRARYLYHISSISQSIDPNVNIDEIYDTVKDGLNGEGFAIYNSENFILHASKSDDYFNAHFKPNIN